MLLFSQRYVTHPSVAWSQKHAELKFIPAPFFWTMTVDTTYLNFSLSICSLSSAVVEILSLHSFTDLFDHVALDRTTSTVSDRIWFVLSRSCPKLVIVSADTGAGDSVATGAAAASGASSPIPRPQPDCRAPQRERRSLE